MNKTEREAVAIVWALAYHKEVDTFDYEADAVRSARAGCRANVKAQLGLTGKKSHEVFAVLTDAENIETLKATEILSKEGFTVLPYMTPDLAAAKKMIEAGASCVMPLGSPIGTGRGLKTEELVKIMVDELDAPVIVDAGIGKPSDAARCMELGCAAVLVNTALATAENPVSMAKAFSQAVAAGRLAYISGTAQGSNYASASSPLTGFLREGEE